MPLPIIAPFAPPIFFVGVGHLSKDHLHAHTLVLAERMCEHVKHRAGGNYAKAVEYTQWKLIKRYEKDLGYKAWSLYHDLTWMLTTYWKFCYFMSALSRAFGAPSGM